MTAILLASTSRMTFTNLVRLALRQRGYVENEEQRGNAIFVAIWAHGQQVGCDIDAAWLFREVLDALAEEAIEAHGVSVIVGAYGDDGVEEADVVRVDGGEVVVRDAADEANEILHDWTDGHPSYDRQLMETSLAYALLDMEEPSGDPPEHEQLRFALDAEVAAEMEAHAQAKARSAREASERSANATPPAEWKRFRHPDGRRWAIRLRIDGFDLEMTDADGDVITRARAHANPRTAVTLLIAEQLNDGFVDEPS